MIFLDIPMATDITEVFLRHKANKLINPSLVIVNLLFALFQYRVWANCDCVRVCLAIYGHFHNIFTWFCIKSLSLTNFATTTSTTARSELLQCLLQKFMFTSVYETVYRRKQSNCYLCRKQRSLSFSPGLLVMIIAILCSLALSITSWSLIDPRG